MNPAIAPAIRTKIQDLEAELERQKTRLKDAERECQHDWLPIEYCPEYQEAYTIPGDAPGTMGIDWRGPTYVPAKTTPKWRRTCRICGRVEKTVRAVVEPNPKQIPQF